MDHALFKISADDAGRGQVVVNGDDVSRLVGAYSVTHQAGKPPTLTLQLRPGVGDIEGVGIVQVVKADDERNAILAFLDAVNPEELEQLTLAGLGMGEGSATPRMIEVLKGWASGDMPDWADQ